MDKGPVETNDPAQGFERSLMFVISLLIVVAVLLAVSYFMLHLDPEHVEGFKMLRAQD